MKIFVIGSSRSGKTPFAERVAERLECPRIGASEWARARFPGAKGGDRQAFVEAITRFSMEQLRRDPDACVRHVRSTYDLSNDCVIEGVRNPRDFVALFDPREDWAVFLSCEGNDLVPTVFESGIGTIRSYVEYLLSCGMIADRARRVREYRYARYRPDADAPRPSPGTYADLDAVIQDFLESLPPARPRRETPSTSRVHAEIAPIRCAVRQEYLYDMDPAMAGPLVPASAYAVSSYRGSAPTFSVVLEDGSAFSYVPPQALVDPTRLRDEPALDAKDLSYHDCPDEDICVHRYAALAGPVQAHFKRKSLWLEGTYVLTIDWYRGNDLLHLIALENGQYAFLPQHKLKFGEGAERAFRPYKKMRSQWSVG